MFFNFLDVFQVSACQYLFFGIAIYGLFSCLKRLVIGR